MAITKDDISKFATQEEFEDWYFELTDEEQKECTKLMKKKAPTINSVKPKTQRQQIIEATKEINISSPCPVDGYAWKAARI